MSLGRDFFYTADDADPDNGLNDLWKVDTAKGRVEKLDIKIGGIFAFSKDGRYMCYVYNDHAKHFQGVPGSFPAFWEFIPVLRIRDMKTGEMHTYDFYDTFLVRGWGALTEIEPQADRFNVEFSIDGGTLGKGYVLLSDKKWYPVE